MVKSTSNRGRPTAVYRPKLGGDPIVGLMRLKDGRWRASGQQKYTFTEPDEKLAIAHFEEWKARQQGKTISIPVAAAPIHNRDEIRKAILQSSPALARQSFPNGRSGMFSPPGLAEETSLSALPPPPGIVRRATSEAPAHPPNGHSLTVKPHPIRMELIDNRLEFYNSLTQESAFFAWLRRLILEKRHWVAQQTGIASLTRLPELPELEKIPTLAGLGDIWEEHFRSSPEQKRKCRAAFEDFTRTTSVASIDDIKPDVVVKYRDVVYGRNLSGKTQSNLFTRIRRYLAFFRERAVAMEAISRSLGYLALLTPNESTVSLDPRPIEPAEWQKLLAVARGDGQAMVLLMLNCAMYLQEVIKLQWSDIHNGCLVTHRAKTGKCVRVAVLWKETLTALEKINRRGSYLFYNYAGAPLGIKGAEKRFRDLRDEAKVAVTSSQLRDGAYTAAVEANVTASLCQLLVGHRSGIADHYVKRKPEMVAPACEAIHRAYFGG